MLVSQWSDWPYACCGSLAMVVVPVAVGSVQYVPQLMSFSEELCTLTFLLPALADSSRFPSDEH